MKPKNIQIIFHRDHDGVAAAYCAWRIFGDAAEYRTIQYGEPFPTLPADSRVFILDFSWPDNKATAEALANRIADEARRHQEFVIIDHHAGPVEEALGLISGWFDGNPEDNFEYRFDETKSGVELAYEYFRDYSPEAEASWPQQIPHPLALIGDRDLWRHENDRAYDSIRKADCQALHAGLFLIPFKWGETEWFEALHQIVTDTITPPADGEGNAWLQVIREGMVALRVQQTSIEAICKNAFIKPYSSMSPCPSCTPESVSVCTQCGDARFVDDIAYLPTVQSSIWQSEIAHQLLIDHPDHPAAVVYYEKPKPGSISGMVLRIHSIRSRKDSDFALRVARSHTGGGGHKQSAGFTTEEIP